MVDELGKRRGWKVVVHTKGSCPSNDAARVLPTETSGERQASCTAYNEAVDKAILADRSISLVLATSFTRAYDWSGGDGAKGPAAGEAGFASRFERWSEAGKDVVVIADVPAPAAGLVPDCIAGNSEDPSACAMPRDEAVVPDIAVAAARSDGLRTIDLTDLFCDDTTCYSQVGDVIVYKDRSHLSTEYSRLLAPFVDERLG
jgi:hypothetical protein